MAEPQYDVYLYVDTEFITKFKRYNAAVDTTKVGFIVDGNSIDIIINYDENINSNRVKFQMHINEPVADKIAMVFNVAIFNEIFSANKISIGRIWLSKVGLCKIVLKSDNFVSKYFTFVMTEVNWESW